ncbi:hypothetical protein HUN58_15400 [Curtobacterium sp. Csp1]|uniref:hypothetical protein n=1 Tax=unclassified Curtobacterium TaxID=257496 RepID=UPI0015989D39|nr:MULTISPECIES: hypothetical protein [unclassified Curtobacterium]QKS14046.1 hypothetical protein HUN60_13635 [Curtobacterium sp. csp3]QKS21131.1 hypothetical protein HUN58_15400 [Curtobacterium sp. Csp1]
MVVPVPLGTEDRTARLTLHRPDHWHREDAQQADLRVTGDDVVLTVRSRPSDRTIAEEHTSLLERLPGSVEGLRLIGSDAWTAAGAPARLVEYVRPTADEWTEGGDVAGAHLLFVTGRHRVDVTVERPLRRLVATDDLVFAVLESVRATEPTPARPQRDLEPLPAPAPAPVLDGPRVSVAALATLQGLVGRRWNPTLLRTEAGRELVEAGLVGRLGTLPESTQALLAPWQEGTQPVTLEQHLPDGRRTRLQAWSDTVVDGTDDVVVGSATPERVVALLAGRLGIGPTWTFPFRTGSLRADLLGRRVGGGTDAPDLPASVAEGDPRLARFWSAPWTVSHLLRPGRPEPVTIVHAAGHGFARVGRTTAGETSFRTDSPANVYRSVVRAVLAAPAA